MNEPKVNEQGTHEDGLGWAPDGEFCGECSSVDCSVCVECGCAVRR